MFRAFSFFVFIMALSHLSLAAGGKRWGIGLNDPEGINLRLALGSSKNHVMGLSYTTEQIGILSSQTSVVTYTGYGLSYIWHYKSYGENGVYLKLGGQNLSMTKSNYYSSNYSGTTTMILGYFGYQSFWGPISSHIGIGTKSPTNFTLDRVSGTGPTVLSGLFTGTNIDFGIALAF